MQANVISGYEPKLWGCRIVAITGEEKNTSSEKCLGRFSSYIILHWVFWYYAAGFVWEVCHDASHSSHIGAFLIFYILLCQNTAFQSQQGAVADMHRTDDCTSSLGRMWLLELVLVATEALLKEHFSRNITAVLSWSTAEGRQTGCIVFYRKIKTRQITFYASFLLQAIRWENQ